MVVVGLLMLLLRSVVAAVGGDGSPPASLSLLKGDEIADCRGEAMFDELFLRKKEVILGARRGRGVSGAPC